MTQRRLLQTDPLSPTADFEAFEATTWEDRAGGYERFFAEITDRTIDAVLDAARVGRGTRLLDVACGPGDVAGTAAARGASATGIDITDAMTAIARVRWPNAEFRVADAHDLPFADASFDAVTASFALMHLGRPERAADEWVRVIVPGGRLAVAVWDDPSQIALFGEILDALEASGARPADIPDGPSFFRFAADREMRSLLARHAMTDVTIRTVAFTHRVADTAAVWDGILNGSVRTAAAIRGQSPAIQQRVHDDFTERMERYRSGLELELPISVKVASGTVPKLP